MSYILFQGLLRMLNPATPLGFENANLSLFCSSNSR